MRVAMLGAGPVGTAMAGLAARAGHAVALWSPRGGGTRHLRDEVRLLGALDGRFPVRVAADPGRALEGAEAIFLAVPGHALPALAERLAPLLSGNPALFLCPPGGDAPALARRLAAARGVAPRVAALPVPPLAARREDAAVRVTALRARWWMGALDPRNTGPLSALLGAATGLPPEPLADAAAAALADPLARLGAARRLGAGGNPARLLAALEAEAAALAAALRRPGPGLAALAEGGALADAAPGAEETAAGLRFLAAEAARAGTPAPLAEAALRVLAALGP